MVNEPNQDPRQAAADAAIRRSERSPFVRFNLEDWVKWINRFLNADFCEPSITIGAQEPCVVLGNVYHELETKNERDLFDEAIKILFETTPIISPNSRYLRSILELLGLVKPYQAKSLARKHLFGRSFQGLEDGGLKLHTLLLIVNSKYEIDEELLDFINRTMKTTDDFSYLLTGLRIVSETGGPGYLNCLETVLPHVDQPKRAILLSRELGDIIFLYGSRHFCEWYGARLRAVAKQSTGLDAFEFLEEALKKVVFRSLDLSQANDNSFNTLIAAQLHATDRFYTAKQIMSLARLHSNIGKEPVVDALVNIWNRLKTRTPDKGLPWYYTTIPREYQKFRKFPSHISSGPNPDTSNSDKFMEEEEPVLAQIFEAVKDATYGNAGLVKFKTV